MKIKMYSDKKNKNFRWVLLLFILTIGFINGAYGADMKLLAVSTDSEGNLFGSGANLNIEINRGTGRVFMETYPFTKLDTQMSTHFAREIACDYLDKDCKNYDFFYTIKSSSAIIGGPSAGAAITFLTIAQLQNRKIPDDFSITGTINHGGLIGRVGGIKEKIEAASQLKLKRVFIPKGERYHSDTSAISMNISDQGEITDIYENKNISNNKTDLVEYGKKLGVEVIEVSTIRDLVCEILKDSDACFDEVAQVNVNEEYQKTMIGIGVDLCNRTNQLIDKINSDDLEYALKNNVVNYSLSEKLGIDIETLVDLMMKRRLAYEYERYYSMSSFCFSSNLILQSHLQKDSNYEDIVEDYTKLEKSKEFFQNQIENKKINSITDLQTYIIVKERLYETQEYIDFMKEQQKVLKEENLTQKQRSQIINASRNSMAFATERFYSASMWADFFDRDKNVFEISENSLKESCMKKIYEAQERVEYLKLYYPYLTQNAQKAISIAMEELDNGDYAYCLFKASKAKSQIDNMIGAFSVTQDNVNELLEDKRQVSARLIQEQQSQGVFPILGFSYYEYAQTLGDSESVSDKSSALLYYDYAIEFSNLDMYFEKERNENLFSKLTYFFKYNLNYIFQVFIYSGIFLLGCFVGITSTQLFSLRVNEKPNVKSKKKKSTKKAKKTKKTTKKQTKARK